MKRTFLVTLLLAWTAADARAQTPFHVTGVAIDHDHGPMKDRIVGVTFSYDDCPSSGSCTPRAETWYQGTGADGRFDITAILPAAPTPYARNQKLTVSTYGSEAGVYIKRSASWNADPAFWTVDVTLRNAPAHVSQDGGYWARRIGCGEYPLFVVEGFDPGDSMKTGDRFDGGSWLGLLYASQLPGGGGLLDYLTSHNYSVYMLASGDRSGNSIRASEDGDITKGMAYQAVHLAKTITDQLHPGKPIVIGGYSAGGLTVRAGLTKWCDGSYQAASGGFLDAGCAAVSLWYSADSPQKGATAPISLQRYLHDDDILDQVEGIESIKHMMDSTAAQEMLRQSIGDQVCNTNCDDMFGCDSSDFHYTEECVVQTEIHDEFMAWVGGFPTRAGGGAVPSVGFSLGGRWRDDLGAPIRPDYCWNASEGWWAKFLENEVDCWGNHIMKVNTAGGTGECVPGSRMNSLLSANEKTGGVPWCPGDWHMVVSYPPTYISTDSALDWDVRDARWNDYWYAPDNLPHAAPIPAEAGGFLLAWITEYSTGAMQAPLCPEAGGPPQKSLGKKGVCRMTGGTGNEAAQVCTQSIEPLQVLVGTHRWGADVPAVGVLRSNDFGAASPAYTKINTGLTGAALDVHGVELDPFDSDIAYIYGPDGIYRNPKVWTDGVWTNVLSRGQFEAAAGRSFPSGWALIHAIPSPTVQGRIHALVEGQDLTAPRLEERYRYYALYSGDGGASWRAQQVGQTSGSAIAAVTGGTMSIRPSPTDPGRVWLTSKAYNFGGCVSYQSCSTVWQSSDGGSSWSENTLMRFGYTRTTHLAIPTGGDRLRFREPVGLGDPSLNGSTDDFLSVAWSVQIGGSPYYWARRPNSFYIEPTDPERIVVSATREFLVSEDAGRTWTRMTDHEAGNGYIVERGTSSWKSIVASAYTSVWNPSYYTNIAYTTNGGRSWQKRNGNLKDQTTALTMSVSAVRLRP